LNAFWSNGTAFVFRDKQSKNGLLGFHDPAEEDISITLVVGNYLPVDKAYYLRRPESSLLTRYVKNSGHSLTPYTG
jgi:hypothetical protein